MRRAVFLLPFLLGCPGPATPQASDDAAIAGACKEYLDLTVQLSPETATELGLHQHDARLDDRSAAGIERADRAREAMLAKVTRRFAQPRASKASLNDLALLESELSSAIEWSKKVRPHERRPDFYTEPMSAIFAMTARDYAPAAERARNALARMESIPAQVAAAKANLKAPPRVWTQIGIDRAKSAEAFFEAQRPFLDGALSGDARVAKAIDAAKGAYRDYAAFLEKEILPRGKDDYAVGPELFNWLLEKTYFLEESADELHAIGKRLMEKTSAEMDALARKVDPAAKGWPEVVERLKGKHPTSEDLIPSYAREVSRARKFLSDKDVVSFPQGEECVVMATPEFLRSTITAAYNSPPPFHAEARGFFFVTPVDPALPKDKQEEMLRENDHGDQVDTAVHEAYPGHHLQHVFARLHPSVIRKMANLPLFSEGWALYSEELMHELGYYTGEERLMQLEWTLVRAARVVIDVGLHTRGMSFDEAIRILTRDVHLEETLAMSEVKRYTESPTQPLSYLIGREMIFKLRERIKAKKGPSFSLKEFHTDLLSRGTIPPGLIEREML
jgi:uncharacterized protein (DUF885 family)